jgi:hypothetical protein
MKDKSRIPDGTCPLNEFPCPRGKKAATQCLLQFNDNFDPMSSFADRCMLECARERAEQMRERATKYVF